MGFATVLSLCILGGGGGGIPVGQALLHTDARLEEPEGQGGLLFCALGSDTIECLPACTERSSEAPEPGVGAARCLPRSRIARGREPMASEYSPIIQVNQENRTITFLHWSGRTGNNLNTLVTTFYVAHVYNCTRVYFPGPPRRTGDELALLSVPRQLRIDLDFPALESLRPWLSSLSARTRIPPVTRGAAQTLAEHYLRPLFNEATRAACAHAAADVGDAETLVVHLRSGDMLRNFHRQTGLFAPCAFANKIMAARGFKRAVLVTEPDLQHPCIKFIHHVKRVQSVSVPEDACTLMHARNLIAMSRSTFSDSLGMFNPHLEEYHLPASPYFPTCQPAQPGAAASPAATPASAKIFYYGIFGWEDFETSEQKMHYLAHADESKVHLVAECPLASEAHLQNG